MLLNNLYNYTCQIYRMYLTKNVRKSKINLSSSRSHNTDPASATWYDVKMCKMPITEEKMSDQTNTNLCSNSNGPPRCLYTILYLYLLLRKKLLLKTKRHPYSTGILKNLCYMIRLQYILCNLYQVRNNFQTNQYNPCYQCQITAKDNLLSLYKYMYVKSNITLTSYPHFNCIVYTHFFFY